MQQHQVIWSGRSSWNRENDGWTHPSISKWTFRRIIISQIWRMIISERLFRILHLINYNLFTICVFRKKGDLSRTYDFSVLIRKKLSAKNSWWKRSATSILKYSVINNPLNVKGLTLMLLTYNGLRHNVMCQPCQIPCLTTNKYTMNMYNCNLWV